MKRGFLDVPGEFELEESQSPLGDLSARTSRKTLGNPLQGHACIDQSVRPSQVDVGNHVEPTDDLPIALAWAGDQCFEFHVRQIGTVQIPAIQPGQKLAGFVIGRVLHQFEHQFVADICWRTVWR